MRVYSEATYRIRSSLNISAKYLLKWMSSSIVWGQYVWNYLQQPIRTDPLSSFIASKVSFSICVIQNSEQINFFLCNFRFMQITIRAFLFLLSSLFAKHEEIYTVNHAGTLCTHVFVCLMGNRAFWKILWIVQKVECVPVYVF